MPSRAAVAFIHPDFEPIYYGFYLEGLRRLLGRSNVRLGLRAFPGDAAESPGGKSAMRVVVESGMTSIRLAIEADDPLPYDPQSVAWADHVGKVSYDAAHVPPALAGRVTALGPGFGVRAWSLAETAVRLAAIAVGPLPLARKRQRALGYLRTWARRAPEVEYRAGESDPGYLFFVGKAWRDFPSVNPPRAAFVRAARSVPGVRFEGGLVLEEGFDSPDLRPFAAPRAYPIREYIAAVRRSVVAFNAPAVDDCLGWKLGEFLALGKAVISLPLRRELATPLVHGEHLHVIGDDETEMQEAVALLRGDAAYRRRLEANARAYYDRHLAPQAVMRRLLADAGLPVGDLP